MPAKIPNPRKVFQWRIEMDGVDQFAIQKLKLPKPTIDKVEHGDTNHTVKTPGMIKFDDMTVEKLCPMSDVDTWAWNWLFLGQDPVLGGGVLPQAAKRDVVVKEMDSTGQVVLNRYLIEGAWVCEIDVNEKDRMSSDNVIETVVFSVDTMIKL